MTNNINHFKEIIDNAWIKHSKDQFRAPTTQDTEISIQTCLMPLALKTQNDSFIFVHELKQEKHADLKYVESLKKEIDEPESNKAEFSNMYDMILQECVSNEVMCSYLLSFFDLDVLAELQCLYLHKVKECDCLAQKLLKQTESVSKEVHIELLQHFANVEKHSISLEVALQKKEQERGKGTWGGRVRVFGIVPVSLGAQEIAGGEGVVLAGKTGWGYFKCQQDTQPIKNIQPTSAPSTPTYVYAEENNHNQAEEEYLHDNEFTNPFCTSVQEVAEFSSHNI
nr:hypothetical protein [Tanacetum cinerariifolium]